MPLFVHFNRISLKWQMIIINSLLCVFTISLLLLGLLVLEYQKLSSHLNDETNQMVALVEQFPESLDWKDSLNQIRSADHRIDQIQLFRLNGQSAVSNRAAIDSTYVYSSVSQMPKSSHDFNSLTIGWDLKVVGRELFINWLKPAVIAVIGVLLLVTGIFFITNGRIIRPLSNYSKGIEDECTIPDDILSNPLAPEFDGLRHSLDRVQNAESRAVAAEQSGQDKMDFLAHMSHEIRTPLGAMLGFGKLLVDGELKEQEQEYVDIINQNGEFLLRILNDVLDMSKVEAGQLELEESPLQLESVSALIMKMLTPLNENADVRLFSECEGFENRFFIGDEYRLKQVLINLLSNAVKFTEAGSVSLHVQPSEPISNYRSPDLVPVRFEVRDTGMGMTEDQVKRIFDPFTQAEVDVARKFGGTGLGLMISKQLVERMGGELTVKSEIGKGSIFSFEIQLTLESRDFELAVVDAPQQDFEATSELRILVAEDEVANRRLIDKFFAILGYSIEFAHDGRQCIEMLSSDQEFDAIFLDLHMPHCNGMEIASRIRGGDFGRQCKNAKLAIMSADVLAHDEGNKLVDRFIDKPIDMEHLKSFLHSIDSANEVEELRPLSILVVEDQELNRRLINQVFSSFGFEPDFANDGVECIEYLETNPQPDMIFLDLRMPRMDGWTLAKKIRDGEVEKCLADIPIAIVSAEIHSEETCREIGVDEFIPKPFDINRIRDFVDRVRDQSELVVLSN